MEPVELHVVPFIRGTVQVLLLHTAQDCSGSTPTAKALPLGKILDASIAHSLSCMPCCSLSINCNHIDTHNDHLPPTCLQAAEFLSYTLETLIPYVNSTTLHLLHFAPVALSETSSTQSSSGRRRLSSPFEDHVQFLEPVEGSFIAGAAPAAAHRAAVARLLDQNGALTELAPALKVSPYAGSGVQWQSCRCCSPDVIPCFTAWQGCRCSDKRPL